MTTPLPAVPAEDRTAPARRRTWLALGGAAAVLLVAYLALVLSTGDGLPRGTRVLGVDVGGQSEQQAAATLASALGPQAAAPIEAVVGGEHVTVVPADAGLAFDPEATVAGLGGRAWNPVTLLSALTGGPEVAPAVAVDQEALHATLTAIAADSDTPAVEPTLVVADDGPRLTPGRSGTVLDRDAAASALTAAYLVSRGPVALPQVPAAPSVDDTAAAAARDLAAAAVAEPVTVRVGGVSATIPAATLRRALSFVPSGGALVPRLDGAVLRAAIAPAVAGVEKPGRDARWDVSSGRPVLVPSRTGRGVNAGLLADSVVAVLGERGAQRSVEARIGTIQPSLTTAQARELGITEQLSSFTQYFPYAAYRVQNIGQAARSINGTLLRPGETFSLNKTLGERTVAHGYTVGYVIGPGGVFKEDLGGGVSTSATATWTAAFYAGLERVHTQAHSIWISRYRAGLEATVAWGAFDMSFRNDTPHGVYITTIMTSTSITVQMWGQKVYDRIEAVSGPRTAVVAHKTVYDDSPTCHAQSGQDGFSIDVFRVFVKDGEQVRRERISTRYRPSPEVVCGPDPATATATASPSPSGSGSAGGSGSGSPGPSSSAAATPRPSASGATRT